MKKRNCFNLNLQLFSEDGAEMVSSKTDDNLSADVGQEETKGIEIPDFEFIKKLVSTITKSKLIVEGGIWEKWQLEEVVKVNPYAVVIGSSITRPSDITKRFNSVMNLK